MVDYVRYIQTMFLKFKRYNFTQFLLFDQAYRTMQLQEEFGWGTHIPELYETYLSGHNLPTKSFVKPKHQVKQTLKKKAHTCHVFNRGDSCVFNPCDYLHICSLCKEPHPMVKCPRVGKS